MRTKPQSPFFTVVMRRPTGVQPYNTDPLVVGLSQQMGAIQLFVQLDITRSAEIAGEGLPFGLSTQPCRELDTALLHRVLHETRLGRLSQKKCSFRENHLAVEVVIAGNQKERCLCRFSLQGGISLANPARGFFVLFSQMALGDLPVGQVTAKND